MKRFIRPCLVGVSFCLSALAEEAPSAKFIEALKASFAAWDSDHDGSLGGMEIDHALADAEIKTDAAAALAAVKRLERSKTWASIPRTLDGLSSLAVGAKTKDAPDIGEMFADGQKRIAHAKRELFANGSPQLMGLQQGRMGNCFSLAPLGSMLSRDASQVKAMFKDNADGTYDVKIGKKWIHIAGPTDAEVALSSSNNSTGLWSNVYEKAAGVARNEARAEKDRVTTPLDAIARGGSAGTMLAFISGNEMERFTLTWAKDAKTAPEVTASKLKELRSRLIAAFAEHRCVTTGTNKPSMPGLRGGHAYGVIGYNEATDEIRVWDPHGDAFTPKEAPGSDAGFPRKDGICAMPLTVFVKQFAGLAFELIGKTEGPTGS